MASVAGVGFQLASLPIGVERGWITRDEGQRARAADDPPHAAIATTFVATGCICTSCAPTTPASTRRFEIEVSTVDSALFFAGALAGGSVLWRRDRRARQPTRRRHELARVLRSRDGLHCTSAGGPPTIARRRRRRVHPPTCGIWPATRSDSSTFSPPARPTRTSPSTRVVLPTWSVTSSATATCRRTSSRGTASLFTYFFSHAYIDYRRFAADDPGQFGVEAPRVDWVENSRRATLTHRQRCIEVGRSVPVVRRGSMGRLPLHGLRCPRRTHLHGAGRPAQSVSNRDEWQGGSDRPLRRRQRASCSRRKKALPRSAPIASLKDEAGQPLVWRDPAHGGYGVCRQLQPSRTRRRRTPRRSPPPATTTWRSTSARMLRGHRKRPHRPHLAAVHGAPRRPSAPSSGLRLDAAASN